MSIDGKFGSNEGTFFGGPKSYFQSIQVGTVELSSRSNDGEYTPVTVDQTNPIQKQKDLVFNSDPYVIRCSISGNDFDTPEKDKTKLANCFPLMPKFGAPIPKVGESVIIFLTNPNDKYTDRFYIGPIISDLTSLNNQQLLGGSTTSLSFGYYKDPNRLTNNEKSKGIYSEYDYDNTFVINGRNNADIVFKNSEVLIRAGKFVENKSNEFNKINPAYIQVKNGFTFTDDINNAVVSITGFGTPSKPKKISVNNIVADKINLLTYNGSPTFDLTNRDLINNKTPYITDDELNTILTTAHPLVFGDILLEYLVALRLAFQNHVHNHFGAEIPTDRKDKGSSVQDFRKLATELETKMLSKNIRIN